MRVRGILAVVCAVAGMASICVFMSRLGSGVFSTNEGTTLPRVDSERASHREAAAETRCARDQVSGDGEELRALRETTELSTTSTASVNDLTTTNELLSGQNAELEAEIHRLKVELDRLRRVVGARLISDLRASDDFDRLTDPNGTLTKKELQDAVERFLSDWPIELHCYSESVDFACAAARYFRELDAWRAEQMVIGSTAVLDRESIERANAEGPKRLREMNQAFGAKLIEILGEERANVWIAAQE